MVVPLLNFSFFSRVFVEWTYGLKYLKETMHEGNCEKNTFPAKETFISFFVGALKKGLLIFNGFREPGLWNDSILESQGKSCWVLGVKL